MHSGRRSLTAGRRSAKPQKRVQLPPAPLIVRSRRSPLFGTGSFSRLILMIKEAFSDDVIGLPSKVDGPAARCEGVECRVVRAASERRSFRRRHPLADHDSSRPGPCVEHRRVRRLAAMVGGAWCISARTATSGHLKGRDSAEGMLVRQSPALCQLPASTAGRLRSSTRVE